MSALAISSLYNKKGTESKSLSIRYCQCESSENVVVNRVEFLRTTTRST